jgi:hypothetical protein
MKLYRNLSPKRTKSTQLFRRRSRKFIRDGRMIRSPWGKNCQRSDWRRTRWSQKSRGWKRNCDLKRKNCSTRSSVPSSNSSQSSILPASSRIRELHSQLEIPSVWLSKQLNTRARTIWKTWLLVIRARLRSNSKRRSLNWKISYIFFTGYQ